MLDFFASALMGVGIIGLMAVTAITVAVCQLAKNGTLKTLAEALAPGKPGTTNPNGA